MHPTCRNMRTDSNIFSLQHFFCASCLGGKSPSDPSKSTNFLPMQWCNDSIIPRNWETMKTHQNLPESLSRLSCRSNWSNAVHTCPHTSVGPCKPSMHNINAVYPFIECSNRLTSTSRSRMLCPQSAALLFVTFRKWNIFTICFTDILHHPTSSYIILHLQKHAEIWMIMISV